MEINLFVVSSIHTSSHLYNVLGFVSLPIVLYASPWNCKCPTLLAANVATRAERNIPGSSGSYNYPLSHIHVFCMEIINK